MFRRSERISIFCKTGVINKDKTRWSKTTPKSTAMPPLTASALLAADTSIQYTTTVHDTGQDTVIGTCNVLEVVEQDEKQGDGKSIDGQQKKEGGT